MWLYYAIGLILMSLKRWWFQLCMILILLVAALIIIILIVAEPLPPTAYTTQHANCTHAAKLHDKEMRRLLDKIAEQGEIIGAYEFRYRGLTKLEGGG